jgi:hypothetical protein
MTFPRQLLRKDNSHEEDRSHFDHCHLRCCRRSGGLFWNYEVVPARGTSLISEAHAIIGRPLTPLSYAGVARRTVRRCAVGVYYC